MEDEVLKQIEAQNEKLEAIWKSVEKTRKYFLFVLWATIILAVLPLIGLVFAIPAFLNTYLGSFNGLL